MHTYVIQTQQLLRQTQEYRKFIDDIKIKHDQDKTKYEKDKQSVINFVILSWLKLKKKNVLTFDVVIT